MRWSRRPPSTRSTNSATHGRCPRCCRCSTILTVTSGTSRRLRWRSSVRPRWSLSSTCCRPPARMWSAAAAGSRSSPSVRPRCRASCRSSAPPIKRPRPSSCSPLSARSLRQHRSRRSRQEGRQRMRHSGSSSRSAHPRSAPSWPPSNGATRPGTRGRSTRWRPSARLRPRTSSPPLWRTRIRSCGRPACAASACSDHQPCRCSCHGSPPPNQRSVRPSSPPRPRSAHRPCRSCWSGRATAPNGSEPPRAPHSSRSPRRGPCSTPISGCGPSRSTPAVSR